MNILDFVTIEEFYHLNDKLYKVYFSAENKLNLETYLELYERDFYDFYIKTNGNIILKYKNNFNEINSNYFYIVENLNDDLNLICHFGNCNYDIKINNLKKYSFNENIVFQNQQINTNDLILYKNLFFNNWFYCDNLLTLIGDLHHIDEYKIKHSIKSRLFNIKNHINSIKIFRTPEEKILALLKYK